MVDGLLDVLKKQRDSTVSSNEISGQVKTHEKTYGREYRRLKSSMAYTCIWDQGFPTTELLKREEEHLTLRGQARHTVIFCYAEML